MTQDHAKKSALRTVAQPETESDGFMAVEKWWTEEDAGPWGCPIGVELAYATSRLRKSQRDE